MTDRGLVEYDDGALTQYEDVGSDVREAFERHKSSVEIAEHDDSRSLTDVVRSAVDHSKNKQEWKARQEHGPGASLERHWDRLPRGVKADVQDLAQWRDYYGRFTPFAQLCQKNGTDLYTALTKYNRLENLFMQDPVEGHVAICHLQGIDPRIVAQAFWQRVNDPQAWAAERVNNSSYMTGAAAMADTARNSDINAFMKANPGAEHFRDEMSNLLSRVNFPAQTSNWQMLTWAHDQAVKDARAKAAAVKRAAKAVGGAPGSSRALGLNGSGNSTRDAILEAINAQRCTV